MKRRDELSPILKSTQENSYHILIWYNNKRYRFSTGKEIGQDLKPNLAPMSQRKKQAQLLLASYQIAIHNGWKPKAKIKSAKPASVSILQLSNNALNKKLSLNYSAVYKTDLKRTHKKWQAYCKSEGIGSLTVKELTIDFVKDFILTNSSAQSMPNLKRNISALLYEEAESNGVILNFKKIKLPRKVQQLHKPIADVSLLLNDIKDYNDNLYLCALLTYGLLLRPHREIRCLKVNDFNEDFSQLSLGGVRVKSKRNRVIPVPQYIRTELQTRFSNHMPDINIFTLDQTERHSDYFKGLWTKYKKQSSLIQPEQTLYSFRHTGAINVFKHTGSLRVLQAVMGHNDLKTSLTYLRGLEVQQIKESFLPEI